MAANTRDHGRCVHEALRGADVTTAQLAILKLQIGRALGQRETQDAFSFISAAYVGAVTGLVNT